MYLICCCRQHIRYRRKRGLVKIGYPHREIEMDMEELKVGDEVNALFYTSLELNGTVHAIDDVRRHTLIIGILCEDGVLRYTPRVMVRKGLK